jgi:iron complex transport system ATP-binding protein
LTCEDWQAVDQALERTGMASFGGRLLRTLSGGECQQVFIAAALAQEAHVLLLDEPTAFLDYGHRGRIHEILRSVRSETGATVLVTHDLNEAVTVCDRVVALREGRVVHSGTVNEILDREVLHRIYGVEFVITTPEGQERPVVFPEVIQ